MADKVIRQQLIDAIDLHMQAKRTRWQLTDPKSGPFRSNADFEQASLSIWMAEGGSYDHSGNSPTLSD